MQFLKQCPITDKNNEVLLEVVLSELDFGKEEMADLRELRLRKSGGSHDTTEGDGERGRSKRGLFGGMFRKKENGGGSSNSVSRVITDSGVSPMRPFSSQRKS